MKVAFDNIKNKIISLKEFESNDLDCPVDGCNAELEYVEYDNKKFFRSRFHNSHNLDCHFNENNLSFDDIDYVLRHGSLIQKEDLQNEINLSLKGLESKIDIIDFKDLKSYLVSEYICVSGLATFFVTESKGKIKIAVFNESVQVFTIWMPRFVFSFSKLPLNKKIDVDFSVFGILKDSSGFLNMSVNHSNSFKIK